MTKKSNKKEKTEIPTLDSLIAKYPPSKEEINIHFDSEEEEEACDLISSLLPMERPFYNEEGDWIGDDDEAVEERRKVLEYQDKKYRS